MGYYPKNYNHYTDEYEECVKCGSDDCEGDCQTANTAQGFTVTCNRCSFSGSIAQVTVHSCYVQEQGGRCEDYPCCGHTDGDGCQTLPEHTSAYWSNLYASNPDLFDRYMNGEFD